MSARRKGREAAMQYLCGLDVHGFPRDHAIAQFWAVRPTEVRAQAFAETLVSGVLDHREALDAAIEICTDNFRLQRLGLVDRNVLRVAMFELRECPDVPPVVVIDEAIEIARKFGDTDSARFVNGVLHRAASGLGRPLREPAAPPGAS